MKSNKFNLQKNIFCLNKTMATKSQILQWRAELIKDYPTTDPYFIDLILELYEKNPDYVKRLPKRKFKNVNKETPKEIIGSVSVINNPSEEIINKYFQPPIVLKDDEQS